MASLDVYLKGKKVGSLVDSPLGMTFAYDADYVTEPRPEPLSHVLPVRAGNYSGSAVESYFSNLLPDDYVRTRIGEILKIPRENTFALLEAIGGDCAGAIAFYRPGVTSATSVDEYRRLDDDEAVRILADLEKRPLNVGDEGFRISGAGAQDKLVACVRDGHVWLPLNGTPSTHIIKPDIRNYPGSVENEHFCMKLAAACGHDVAACDLLPLRGETYYVTSRYDREIVDGKAVRLHQEDFCQVLGIDPKHKYEAQGGPGLAECQGLLSALDLSSAERVEFWGRVAFNFLVGNGDAHGKNFSVLYRGGHCELAPMYDIMSTTVYPDVGKRMAMKVDGEYAFKWMTLGKFVRQVERLGLGGGFIEGVLRREAHKMLKAAQSLSKRLSRSHPSGIHSEITEGIRLRASQLGVI